jgi:hypothetical protein
MAVLSRKLGIYALSGSRLMLTAGKSGRRIKFTVADGVSAPAEETLKVRRAKNTDNMRRLK